MKMLVLPLMLLSLTAGTVAVLKTVEMMDQAAQVMQEATSTR
jgi:hypothetical protein